MFLVFLPCCVALMVAGALLVIHLLHPPLAADVDHSAKVWEYQLRFRCGLELVEMGSPAASPLPGDSATVVDSVRVVER
jgi:hypothetical protein